MTSEITLQSAVEQRDALARREISARELLELTIQRYERLNPAINAVIWTELDRARQRAVELDELAAAGADLGPLHGLPMTIKEANDWIGTPSTWGHESRSDKLLERNATIVQRVLDAGAVVYGKTNVPVDLADWQSFNPVYGTSNNPWDTSRVPGGSSGGSAASLAAGLAALELGSDIGASIRNPAHYCGVFGHKPTYGLIPLTGHGDPNTDIAVVGPMGRSAADLRLGLDVTAGPEGFEAVGYRLELPDEPREGLADYRVAVMLESTVLRQDAELTGRLSAAIEELEAAGLRVDWEARPEIDQQEAFDTYLTLLRAATGAFLGDEAYEAEAAAAARFDRGDRDYAAWVGHGVRITHRGWVQADQVRRRHRRRWAEFFEQYDLLLCPTAASAAFPHDHEGVRADRTIPIVDSSGAVHQERVTDQLFWAGWSCNVYLPGTVAPAGLTASGLPCGIQIVSPHLHDLRGIAFAALVEDVLGGYQIPPGYD